MASNPMLTANPALLAANPLLAMSMMGNPLAAQAQKAPDPVQSAPRIDPDVQELCDYFHIEERHALRLTEIMNKRQTTFVEDLERLYDVFERANSPAGLLVVKMREMDEGTFVGAMRADKELKAIVKKFAVDATAEAKLADILSRYPAEKKKEYYGEIE